MITKFSEEELDEGRRHVAAIRPASVLAISLLGFVFVVTVMYHGMVTRGPQNYGVLPGFFTVMLLLLFVLVGLILFEVVCLLPLVRRISGRRRKTGR